MENILSIIEFKKDYPKTYKKFFEEKGNGFNSLNNAIDDFLFNIGLSIVLAPVFDKDICVGYISKINIYPQNKLNLQIEDIPVIDDYKRFKNPDKARKLTTLYALGFIEEKFAFRS